MSLQRGRDVRQENKGRSFVRVGQMRGERFKYAQLRQERASIIHIHFIFAGPVESLSCLDLQTRKIDPVAAIKLKVTLRKILPHDSNEFDRAKKTCRHRRVTGGTAE